MAVYTLPQLPPATGIAVVVTVTLAVAVADDMAVDSMTSVVTEIAVLTVIVLVVETVWSVVETVRVDGVVVEESVTVVSGAAAVVVVGVTPMHEHALEYAAGFEQAEAYEGIFEVAARFPRIVSTWLITVVLVVLVVVIDVSSSVCDIGVRYLAMVLEWIA